MLLLGHGRRTENSGRNMGRLLGLLLLLLLLWWLVVLDHSAVGNEGLLGECRGRIRHIESAGN